MRISPKDLLDMELWQFICYMEGFRKSMIQGEISRVAQASLTGQWTGQYWTGKKGPNPKKLINDLENEAKGNTIELARSVDEDEKKEVLDKINAFKKKRRNYK